MMAGLILASLFLPLSHFLISSTPLRAMFVKVLGEKRYSLGYSLLAVAALVWLIFAYRSAPGLPLLDAPQWLKLALVPVIVVAGILAVAGLTTPNPVIVASGALFDRPDIVRGVLRISRNPFFWGAGLFSIAHVLILGDVAGLLAFGSVGFLGIAGASILDAKKARQHGTAWNGMGRVRGGDLEYPVSRHHSGAPAAEIARDRAVADGTWHRRVARRTCFAPPLMRH